ncbi:hypothetical protein B0H19DRAFT_1334890 [Mycena capillaripes]|nr:hypothetical protein B0H19DRAFT_1334890 [Mycena capillaripes]
MLPPPALYNTLLRVTAAAAPNFRARWRATTPKDQAYTISQINRAVRLWTFDNQPRGPHDPVEDALVSMISRSLEKKNVNWLNAPIPFRLFEGSSTLRVVELGTAIAALLGRAEQRHIWPDPILRWSLEALMTDRLVSYAGIVDILHVCSGVHKYSPATVNTTWFLPADLPLISPSVAFGATIAGRKTIRENIRLNRLQDAAAAWPDIGEFPQPEMRVRETDEMEGIKPVQCAEAISWPALPIRWLMEIAGLRGAVVSSVALSVWRLQEMNPMTKNTWLEDLRSCRTEAEFWRVLVASDALMVCCENCEQLARMVFAQSRFTDVALGRLQIIVFEFDGVPVEEVADRFVEDGGLASASSDARTRRRRALQVAARGGR